MGTAAAAYQLPVQQFGILKVPWQHWQLRHVHDLHCRRFRRRTKVSVKWSLWVLY